MKENMKMYRCKKCKNLIISYSWFPFDGLHCSCYISGSMDRKNWIDLKGELYD